MNNSISNPEVQVPTGINLNDKDYITALLTTLKDMEKNYVIAESEASNEYLYNEYKGILERISNLQRETFELMFRYGWYKLEQDDATKINDKYNTLSKELQNLNLN